MKTFGAPHLLGTPWADTAGDPLPGGVPAWLYTWSVDSHDSALIAWPMAKKQPIYVVPPASVDSPEEEKRVAALLVEYSRTGLLTPALDDKFRALATERRRRAPLRFYLGLPLRRLADLWYHPVPDWEMPATSATLRLPEQRAWLAGLNHRSLAFSLVGLLFLFSLPLPRQARAFATLVLVTAVVRSAVLAFAVPIWTQRYTFELLPALLVLAACALTVPAELCARRLARRPLGR